MKAYSQPMTKHSIYKLAFLVVVFLAGIYTENSAAQKYYVGPDKSYVAPNSNDINDVLDKIPYVTKKFGSDGTEVLIDDIDELTNQKGTSQKNNFVSCESMCLSRGGHPSECKHKCGGGTNDDGNSDTGGFGNIDMSCFKSCRKSGESYDSCYSICTR